MADMFPGSHPHLRFNDGTPRKSSRSPSSSPSRQTLGFSSSPARKSMSMSPERSSPRPMRIVERDRSTANSPASHALASVRESSRSLDQSPRVPSRTTSASSAGASVTFTEDEELSFLVLEQETMITLSRETENIERIKEMIRVYDKYLVKLHDSEQSDADDPANPAQEPYQYNDVLQADCRAEKKVRAWRHAEIIDTKVKRSCLQSALASVRQQLMFRKEIEGFTKQIEKTSLRAARVPQGRLRGIKRKGLGALAGLLGR